MLERQLLASISSLLGFMGNGMTTASTSAMLPQTHQFMNENMASWLVGTNALSQLLGIFLSSLFMPKYGRRPFLIWMNIPWLIGWICLSGAYRFSIFLTGFFIVGTACGFYTNLAAVYLVEMAEPHYRGLFGALGSTSYAIGILLEDLLGALFPWRITLLLSALLPLLSFATAFYAPESPNWLVFNRCPDKAKENLFWLRNVEDDGEEFAALVSSEAADGPESRNILDHIFCRQFFKSFFVVTMSMVTGLASGFDSITAYSVDIISTMCSDLNAFWATVLTSVSAVVACAVSCAFIEKVPRRLLFFVSNVGVSLCLFAIFCVLTFDLPKSWVIIIFCIYQSVGNAGILTIPLLLAGEIFPDSTREIGSGLSTICYSILSFVAVKMNPYFRETLGLEMLYLVYACLSTVCLCILYFTMPETKGYSLQQIERRLYGYKK